MAPTAQVPLGNVQSQLKLIVQNLYNLIVQVVEHQGPATEDAMRREIESLFENLLALSQEAPHIAVEIPPEIINYVENGRNPIIYTREMVEALQRMNQMLKGRSQAFLSMQSILAQDIVSAIPELKDDVEKILKNTVAECEKATFATKINDFDPARVHTPRTGDDTTIEGSTLIATPSPPPATYGPPAVPSSPSVPGSYHTTEWVHSLSVPAPQLTAVVSGHAAQSLPLQPVAGSEPAAELLRGRDTTPPATQRSNRPLYPQLSPGSRSHSNPSELYLRLVLRVESSSEEEDIVSSE